MLIRILRERYYNSVLVWDFRTGVVLSEFGAHWGPKEIAFSGNQRIIGLSSINPTNGWMEIYIYDALKGTLLRNERCSQPANGQLNDHWIHEGCLRFATSFKRDGKCVVIIREFQPTSNRLVPVIESYPVSLHDGVFSFSPVSFHASFVTEREVVILDVRKSETLLHEKARQSFYKPRGYFSPNGHFFACGTRDQVIFVWKNTPTGYVHWSTIIPRLRSLGFSFSPAAVSILTWGPGKIQLLHPESHDVASPDGSGNHLVARSADGKYITTVRKGKGIITVRDSHSGNSLKSIDTRMLIQDIKTIGNAIYVTDGHKLVNWHLGLGMTYDVRYDRKGTVDMTWIDPPVLCSVLSNDCSKIAFAEKGESNVPLSYSDETAEKKVTVVMCAISNINAPNTTVPNRSRYRPGMASRLVNARFIDTCTIDVRIMEYGHSVLNIRFSPDERRLLLIIGKVSSASYSLELDLTKDWWIGDVIEDGTDPWSRTGSHSSDGYHVGGGSQWVMDSRHRKLLWLPSNWRMLFPYEIQWIGDFLVLLNGVNPEPIIIEFQPLPHSHRTSSDI